MPNELNIEQQIREAMERGDFDNLKGKGKPLYLDAYFATPEDMRMAHALLRSNDYVPEEVEMLIEIARLKAEIKETTDEEKRSDLTRLLHKKSLALTIALEKYKRKR
jgi:Domain of unknown function (DUF1992)